MCKNHLLAGDFCIKINIKIGYLHLNDFSI